MDNLQPNENEDKSVYPNPETTGTVLLPNPGGQGETQILKPRESNHILGTNGSNFPLQVPCIAECLQSLYLSVTKYHLGENSVPGLLIIV